MNKIDVYLEEMYLQEDLKSLMPNFSINVAKKIVSSINPDNPEETIKKLKQLIPSGVNPKKILPKLESFLSSKFENFSSSKQLAGRVLKNSIPGLSMTMNNYVSTVVVMMSMFTKKSQKNIAHDKNLKLVLKDVIGRARKFGEDYFDEEDDDQTKKRKMQDTADMSVAWAAIASMGIMVGGLLTGAYGVWHGLVTVVSLVKSPWVIATIISIALITSAVAGIWGLYNG